MATFHGDPLHVLCVGVTLHEVQGSWRLAIGGSRGSQGAVAKGWTYELAQRAVSLFPLRNMKCLQSPVCALAHWARHFVRFLVGHTARALELRP